MEITDLSPGGFACACYLVCEKADAVLIDCSATPEAVRDALDRQGARLAAILCTHGHFDHILTADTLFANGWGRTDLYGGDAHALRRSLQALSNLAPDIHIYPGHGGSSTLKNALELIL